MWTQSQHNHSNLFNPTSLTCAYMVRESKAWTLTRTIMTCHMMSLDLCAQNINTNPCSNKQHDSEGTCAHLWRNTISTWASSKFGILIPHTKLEMPILYNSEFAIHMKQVPIRSDLTTKIVYKVGSAHNKAIDTSTYDDKITQTR